MTPLRRLLPAWILYFCALMPAWAGDPRLRVPLPSGETPLTDIGLYQVSWQSYGKEPVAMPPSWAGHFDADTGISYTRWNRVLNRETLLMHSPWHVPPGRVWVDYPLILPSQTPIRLSFGIAMGPDVAVPDRSDGVTFSCFLIREDREQELMRHHQTKAEWQDYEFDLSELAGQEVTLRLQVEPGPKNNASWDYSFFGNPRITVGEATATAADTLRELMGTRAYRATEGVSRIALSNRSDQGITPSNLLPFRNTIGRAESKWQFTYEGEDGRLVYTYQPATGTLDDFTVQWDDGQPFQPALGGGALALVTGDGQAPPRPLRGGAASRIEHRNDLLEVDWAYDLVGRSVTISWRFGIRGKALEVSAQCAEPVLTRFSLGAVGMAPLRKTYHVPYLLGQVHYLPVQGTFVCRYLDWTRSHASACPQETATYEPRTDGTRHALRETGYISVSPEVNEVLPNLPHPPSPYLAQLGPLIMLDLWGHHQGTFQGDADKLRELKDNGVDHLAIIQHVWQRFGYDVKLPDHLPADPRYGGDAGMIAFGQAARDCGYVWSLHENYIDLYPDAPSYDPAARVLRADGTPSPAWFNAGTGVQSFGLKCNRALGYAEQNSPEIHRRFGTTAAYLDVHTCVPPWHQLDHEANQPLAAMALAKVQFDTELFQFERDTHRGPLFGEGNNHFYWAGRCDGVEAQVSGGEDHTPFLDFDLLKIHPQMVNHGMGYYERWFRRGYDARWGLDAGSVEQFDKYRAMELAYGHAGFLGNRLTHNIQAVAREHHLMHPVQRLYGTAQPTAIHYEVNGQFVSTSAALVAGDTSRQRICYDSGLTLWINWRDEPWPLPALTRPPDQKEPSALPPSALLTAETAPTLPQWGFYARGPQTEAGTLLKNGRVTDFARCPEYLFADARTWFDQPYLTKQIEIEPRLRAFEYLGQDRIRVTYEWIVGESLDDNYQCFVHGIPANGTESDGIDFQQDHPLPKPTRQWQPGDVIVDGPYELRVPDQRNAYDLVIGLFKGPRLPLKGVQASSSRILLARLSLQRQNGQITGINAQPATPDMAPPRTQAADFTQHTNPPGTLIDFGPVSTDGAVKINVQPDHLVVFPYPRTQPFRVSLDLNALAPDAHPSRIRVHALEAGTQRDLGAVEAQVDKGRLTFRTTPAEAGRYRVSWGSSTAWAPKLYGLCMEIHDAKKRTLPEQIALLQELGFDGAGYPLWLGDELDANLKILDQAGLPLFLVYTILNLDPTKPAYDAKLPDALRRLKGRPVTVAVLLQDLPPGDPQGRNRAVELLRQLGNLAAENQLRISVYHHWRDWTESLAQALDVVRLADHPQVGVNFNLCHWLKVSRNQDYRPLLKANANRLFAVTINGAQGDAEEWTNGLIQPLDCGDFDNRALLATLRDIGYRGPIGLMCYGIQGDAREHLQRSRNVWQQYQTEWTE